MQPTNLRNQLLILGAQARLVSLNKERNELLKILNQTDNNVHKEKEILKDVKRKPYKRKGLHWTQKPENRAKMLKQIRKANKAR